MNSDDIREAFLSFFEERGHRRVASSSLIPPPETGLLLTNAGMNQFIPYFLGQATPPFIRATTSQKSFRTVDIDNVGHTARHLTLFEMLGNFSFGDYFKAESCAWGLELVTEVYGLDRERIWVTVYEEDEETEGIWRDLGMPSDRIVRRGKADNYWWTHAAGPAGPCSEIFLDRGEKYGPDGGPAVDEERYMEIWNHVFMQEEVDGEARVKGELPAKNIDTGASLERLATVLNGLDSFYDTDLFVPLMEEVQSLSGKRYGADERDDVAMRVVAEHARATTFLIADGVQPSNEGRGYILRRMLRRAVSYARRLGITDPFMERLARATVTRMGHVYPELRANEAFALQVTTSEEERFSATLRQGMHIFREAADRTPPGGTMAGEDVFKLFDTFGFPPQLTEELATDAGLSVDSDRFAELMEEQRARARAAAKRIEIGLDAGAAPPSEFVGYARPEAEATVQMLLDPENREIGGAEEGQEVRAFLGRTPFYAESGGQVGDEGEIRTNTGTIRVRDVQWAGPESIMHIGTVSSGEIRPGQDAMAEIDRGRREATARAHTSTHILHATLKDILGAHARQAGSLVAPGRLRFDFPHPAAVRSTELEETELLANRRLAFDDDVRIFETSIERAKQIGAVMLFGEKYGDVVRVAEIGDYSRELCGGTHVPRTGHIALIRILREGSIGAGMRRVEALVGPDAIREINADRELLRRLTEALGSKDPESALEHARSVVEENRRLRNQLGALRHADRSLLVERLTSSAGSVDGITLVVSELPGEDVGGLREIAQKVRDKLAAQPAAVVLGAGGERAQLVAACTMPAVARGVTAPLLLEHAARVIGGGAGGKEILANAGGRAGERIPEALGGIPARLSELLGRT